MNQNYDQMFSKKCVTTDSIILILYYNSWNCFQNSSLFLFFLWFMVPLVLLFIRISYYSFNYFIWTMQISYGKLVWCVTFLKEKEALKNDWLVKTFLTKTQFNSFMTEAVFIISVNFAKFLRTPFYRTRLDDCFYITSKNGNRKITQLIRTASGPDTRMQHWVSSASLDEDLTRWFL